MRFFDWLTLISITTLTLANVYQWFWNRSIERSLECKQVMLAHQMIEKYNVGKPISTEDFPPGESG